MLNQYGKDFVKILESIRYSKSKYEVFSDWLIMTAATLYSWKKDKNVEEEYLHIANQYTKEELDKHAQLLAITVEALEKEEQDFLGEVFTFAELTNSRNGQFFTPYHISRMSAEMTIGDTFPEGRIVWVNDPTCGSGGMLVAAASVMKEKEFNYQQNALFIAQDIDARCARMAFIQLSLIGAPAIIYCMNTLTMQEYWHRETIGYYIADMDFRLKWENTIRKLKEIEAGVQKPATEESKPVEIKMPSREAVQGELF